MTRTVAVTGVGALIGQGIAAGLRAMGDVRVIGVDRRGALRADQLCDRVVRKPAVDEDSAEYLTFWRDLIAAEGIELILPGISIDMMWLNAHRGDLDCALGLNDAALIGAAEDKAVFAQALAPAGVPMIPTCPEGTSWEDALTALGPAPILLKPARGEGSQGIVKLRDRVDFDYWTQVSAGNFLLQRIVGTDAEEYTVGLIGFGDGTGTDPITFRRQLTRAGNTGSAQVAEVPAISQATAQVVAHFKPLGPTNLQFRLEGDTPYLLEVNPRFSSSCSLRLGFGYNEAALAVALYLEGARPATPAFAKGRAERYNADLFSVGR